MTTTTTTNTTANKYKVIDKICLNTISYFNGLFEYLLNQHAYLLLSINYDKRAFKIQQNIKYESRPLS